MANYIKQRLCRALTYIEMANYIKQSLEEGETIIFKGRLHWSYIFRYLLFSLLFLVGGIIVIYLAYYKYPEQKTALFYIGIALLVLAFFTWKLFLPKLYVSSSPMLRMGTAKLLSIVKPAPLV